VCCRKPVHLFYSPNELNWGQTVAYWKRRRFPRNTPPPQPYETNVDRCVPGRTTVHFFICVLCGLCLVVYLLLMQLHCSKHNQRECRETVWCVESWILLLTKLIRKNLEWAAMHNVSGASIVLLYLSLINCLRPVRSKRNQCFSLCFSRGVCNEIRNVSICLDHRCFDI